MIKFAAILAAVFISFVFPFAHADNTIVTRESFLKHRERWMRKRAKQKARQSNQEQDKDCKVELGQVVPFPSYAALYESTNASTVNEPGLATTLEQLKSSYDPTLSLTLLEESKRRKMTDLLLRTHVSALKKFEKRMIALTVYDVALSPDDVKQFSRLLNLATRDIFYKNPEGENPIANVTAFFKQHFDNFRRNEKYQFVTALLRGVDIAKAIQADRDGFVPIIAYWHIQYSQGLRSPMTRTDRAIQTKINALADQFPQLKPYDKLRTK